MMKILSNSYILFFGLGLWLTSCTDQWKDHIGDVGSQKNLYEVVQENPRFSVFANLLEQSGYAEDLKASKNYTLIIPTNEAINAIMADYNFGDTSVLRSFVGYHIINSIYSVNETADTVLAKNFRNKYVEFLNGTFDEISPVESNLVAGNGVYHIVETPLRPLLHIFDFVTTRYGDTEQAQAIMSFDTLDIANGVEITRYHPSWNSQVRSYMTREDMKFTYFVVDDDYYLEEYDKLSPYYHTGYAEDGYRPDSTTTFFTKKALLQDFIVTGEHGEHDLAHELFSVAETKFSVDPADIIAVHKVSNGRVYRVKRLNFALTDQIKELKVLGVEPKGFKQDDKEDNIYYRNKRDQNGELYDDIEIYGHNVTAFYAKYHLDNANVVKYKVYGRAIMGLIGDPQVTIFTQYVHFFDPTLSAVNEPDLYKRPVVNNIDVNDTRMIFTVEPLRHDEVYLGEVTQDEFGRLPLLVMSEGTGPIILEYLRFVPILP
jgi:hypothetical protein